MKSTLINEHFGWTLRTWTFSLSLNISLYIWNQTKYSFIQWTCPISQRVIFQIYERLHILSRCRDTQIQSSRMKSILINKHSEWTLRTWIFTFSLYISLYIWNQPKYSFIQWTCPISQQVIFQIYHRQHILSRCRDTEIQTSRMKSILINEHYDWTLRTWTFSLSLIYEPIYLKSN
jgi:hypothetical protein